jgi:hypothetical protein
VLVVIGALAYFGVLNPGKLLPRKCQFAQGLVCTDHKVTSSGVTLRINNGLGNDIEVTGITFTADNGIDACTGDITDVTLVAGDEQEISLSTCTIASSTGTRIKGDLSLTYKNLQTSVTHTISGVLVTDVE